VTPFRTVLFDLDGTLLDHFAAIHRTHTQTMQHFGLPAPSMQQVRRAVGGGLENTIERLFGEKHGHLVPQAVPFYRARWAENINFEVAVLPGAEQLLKTLRSHGVQCAVLTNKHGDSARAVLAHVGLLPLLDGVFGAFDTPWLKPEPEFALHALSTLRTSAVVTCLIGDSPYDIDAAKAAGFPCFCVTTGTHTAEELQAAGADGVFPDLLTLGREKLGVS
jgi:phosphoglycolate phosphatase